MSRKRIAILASSTLLLIAGWMPLVAGCSSKKAETRQDTRTEERTEDRMEERRD